MAGPTHPNRRDSIPTTNGTAASTEYSRQYCTIPAETHTWYPPPAFRLLPSAFCLLPSAFCLLPSAFCLLPSASCLLPSAFCLLPSASCGPPPAFCLLLSASCLPPSAFWLLNSDSWILPLLSCYQACPSPQFPPPSKISAPAKCS